MKQRPPEQLPAAALPPLSRRRLDRTILLWAMALSILPAVLVGAISYHSVHERLEQEIHQHIRTTAALQSAQIQAYGLEPPADATGLAGQPEIIAPMKPIQSILNGAGLSQSGWRIYLIDPDRALVAGVTGGQQSIGDIIPDTAQAQLWRNNRTNGITDGPPPQPFTYTGADDRPVVGTHTEIRLNGQPHALIVEMDHDKAFRSIHQLRLIITAIVILIGSAGLAVSAALTRTLVRPIRRMGRRMARATENGLNPNGNTTAGDEISGLAQSIDGLIDRFAKIQKRYERQSRFMTGLADLHRLIAGEKTPEALCLNALEFLSGRLDLSQADIFMVDETGRLVTAGHYPGTEMPAGDVPADEHQDRVASEMKSDFLRMDELSGLVAVVPRPDLANLIVIPLVMQQTIQGALRLQKPNVFNPYDYRFAEAAAEAIAVALNAALRRRQEQALLHRAQEQAQKLAFREAALDRVIQRLVVKGDRA